MDLISKTGLVLGNGTTKVGDAVTAIDSIVNDLVDAVNLLLKEKFEVNFECSPATEEYSISTAAAKVPVNRRCLGTKIRFKSGGRYVEYSFIGTDPKIESEWIKTSNWEISLAVIDGGEF